MATKRKNAASSERATNRPEEKADEETAKIREEACKMWYLQNQFIISIRGRNSDLAMKLVQSFADFRDSL
ncbi:hypothetical protein AC578_8439 [Pseudocercospora eumusae]|uniref:Uncharacterized protein n=1 Tax=Pseudocercospora eumusae TaxID=321146 RepID=A0A139HRW8_9PEZI|nr:hypothetical protein AC578_8439 [Pseudocercospora eumusae]